MTLRYSLDSLPFSSHSLPLNVFVMVFTPTFCAVAPLFVLSVFGPSLLSCFVLLIEFKFGPECAIDVATYIDPVSPPTTLLSRGGGNVHCVRRSLAFPSLSQSLLSAVSLCVLSTVGFLLLGGDSEGTDPL